MISIKQTLKEFSIFLEGNSNKNRKNLPRTLRVLDFDHTVAFTGEKVYVVSPEGEIVDSLDSLQYANHQLARDEVLSGYHYDFSEFDDVDADSAEENIHVTEILKNFINAGSLEERIILILTARNQEAEQGIRNYLETIDIDHSNIRIVGVGNSSPQKKVDEVDRILDQNVSIEEVSFFDDSLSNTDEMMRFLSTYEREDGNTVIFDIAKIDEDGKLIRMPGYRVRRKDNV
jgi:hypothetical protein